MTYTVDVHAQDASVGRVEGVLAALTAACVDAASFSHVDVAVAYASPQGVLLLQDRLQLNEFWIAAEKRFLVSIDFGFTNPKALTLIAGIPNAEVRVPSGRATLASQTFSPPTPFHAKAYLFREAGWAGQSSLVIGSANLTASALATGSEVALRTSWTGALNEADLEMLSRARPFLNWFDDAWAAADPLADILDEYESRFSHYPGPPAPPEESAPDVSRYLIPPHSQEVSGALSVQLANARALWVRTDELYHNSGPHRPGNQLDTPRGTRVFFGFDAERVPVNSRFGEIEITVPGHSPVLRSVRFGNNAMDKINLPVPGTDGPDSYDHSFLVFKRLSSDAGGPRRFSLIATDKNGLAAIIDSAPHAVELRMGSGREYGLIF
ncbi:hypothetical protein Q9S71_12785 [Microbacterium sp. KSW4-11]|uniref:Phospholipase D-like domain-containing protein n=1 Tax=Microbacterium gawkjiense TaxID=3067309 RepID=A0ABU3GD07_9MICO|nr:hypothetical protein [Microbacterium sp. KSW4-11]MDT3317696.1 hypothetical protein [Microbacterium sp. KSW4-11]